MLEGHGFNPKVPFMSDMDFCSAYPKYCLTVIATMVVVLLQHSSKRKGEIFA